MTEQEKLLILNIIVYSSSFRKENRNVNYGKSIKSIIDDINKPEGLGISKGEWDKIVTTIKEDESFSNITLRFVEFENYKQLNALFIEGDPRDKKNSQALVVFKGTDYYEWHDNADGGQWNITDTKQQQNADNFIKKNCISYSQIIVSGHSKGGNKAQYVGIMNKAVTRAYSFDGQGMGYPFIIKNAKLIEERKDSIFLYNNSSDFVNSLFINMGIENVNYIFNEKSILDLLFEGNTEALMMLHSPATMLDYSGKYVTMKKVTKEIDPLCNVINGLTEYMMLHLSNEDWYYFSNMMMELFEEKGCSGEFDLKKVPENFLPYVLNEGIEYLTKKMNLSYSDALTIMSLLFAKSLTDRERKRLGLILINKTAVLSLKAKLKTIANNSTSNDIVRNFTSEMKDKFEKLVREAQDDEPIWEFWKWDMWEHINDFFIGGYKLETAGNDLDTYYKHLIDMENITIDKMNTIFESVYQADSEFCKTIENIIDAIEKTNKDITNNLLNKINL